MVGSSMLLLSVRAKGEGLGFRSVQGGAVQQCRCTSMLAAPAISSPLTGKQIPRSLPYILHFLELIGQLGGEGFSVIILVPDFPPDFAFVFFFFAAAAAMLFAVIVAYQV